MADQKPSMTSSRPYLVRALHEWITDNGMTPLILVDALADGVQVPPAHVEDGKIILNISMNAVQGLSLEDSFIHFKARFQGVVEEVMVPMSAVQAIYARETSAGMMFPEEEETSPAGTETDENSGEADNGPGTGKSGARPHLRVIK